MAGDPGAAVDTGDVRVPTPWQKLWQADRQPSYFLTRFVLLRLLGVVYFVGFWTAVQQIIPLVGEHGLTPAAGYLDQVADQLGGAGAGFWQMPSIFWLDCSDTMLVAMAWIGAVLSLVVVAGFANSILLGVLWALYMSFVHIGQDWYAFGWEIQLLETGFLAMFLVPLVDPRPMSKTAPPVLVIWLHRWLIARIMLGAGLIKLRGDDCWKELTCLATHYETQPVPNPASTFLHHMPMWFHQLGVLFNHVVELGAPWLLLVPRRWARHVAGGLFVVFQLILISSGNLSFLNWLTIVPALACFDDQLLARVLPKRLVARAERARSEARHPRGQQVAVAIFTVIVLALSLDPVFNLLSDKQAMNTSFTRIHLVNTYGAFGSVGKVRYEIVFQGTDDDTIDEDTEWRDYELPCKPGDVDRRPCFITPYHYRLDWLLWFAAMSSADYYPWTVHMVWKLLHNDPTLLELFDHNPFPDAPPHYIRVMRYRYRFADLGDDAWWTREPLGEWLLPLSVDDPRLREALDAYGWHD